MGLEDLRYVVPHNVHLILIPKVENREQIEAVDQRIEAIRDLAVDPELKEELLEAEQGRFRDLMSRENQSEYA